MVNADANARRWMELATCRAVFDRALGQIRAAVSDDENWTGPARARDEINSALPDIQFYLEPPRPSEDPVKDAIDACSAAMTFLNHEERSLVLDTLREAHEIERTPEPKYPFELINGGAA